VEAVVQAAIDAYHAHDRIAASATTLAPDVVVKGRRRQGSPPRVEAGKSVPFQ